MQGLQGQAGSPGRVARDSRARRDHGHMLGMRQGNDGSVPSNAGSPRVLQGMFSAEEVRRSGRTLSPSASDVAQPGPSPRSLQSPDFITPGSMDEEPLRLCGPGVRAAAQRSPRRAEGGRRLRRVLRALLAIYLINDVLDREQDRRHPAEGASARSRPGALSPAVALTAAAILGVAALIASSRWAGSSSRWRRRISCC